MTEISSATAAPVVDLFEFVRRGAESVGREPVSSFPRVASLSADGHGEVAWRLRGHHIRRADGGEELRLELTLDGTVRMQCVRCLQPVDVPIAATRALRLAGSEAEAEREDPDDDEVDVIAGSRRFAIGELVEDETILALPFAARHDDCRLPDGRPASQAGAGEDGKRPNPFAALAALKGRTDEGSSG